ncbi:MAG: hypothetical protein ACYTGX_05615 [Planctomycetota bacterium]|jgi:hypothetical protein
MPVNPVRALCVAAALAGLAGCAATGDGADPDYVIDAPPTTSRVRSEQAYLDEGFELEMAEKWDSALSHYAAVINGRAEASPRLTANCALRAAMCHMALEHAQAAGELLEGVLLDPYVAPDEDYPAVSGGAGAGVRLAAEARLRELGGDPQAVYARELAARNAVLAEIAVIALARIGDTFSKEALEKAAADLKLGARWRELAAEELKAWGSRRRDVPGPKRPR